MSSDTPVRPSNAAHGDAPLLVDELQNRCMNNAAVAALVLDKFEQQVKRDIRALEHSLETQNLDELVRITHALKGAAGAVAATSLRDLADAMEARARHGDVRSLAEDLAALRRECDRCIEALPALRSALSAL